MKRGLSRDIANILIDCKQFVEPEPGKVDVAVMEETNSSGETTGESEVLVRDRCMCE
jgi:hypothetical protein